MPLLVVPDENVSSPLTPLYPALTLFTVTEPLDPPHIGLAPGYNFVGSQGFIFEAAAVQEALSQGLLEHPEMPLAESLAMAKVFDQIRAQIGLLYPWDAADATAAAPSAKKRRK